jgi:hypothetical protein
MKKFELSITALALISLILNLLQVPNSDIMTLLTLATLAMFYMYFGFAIFNKIPLIGIFKKESYKGLSAKKIVGAIFTGFILSITILGVLFKFHDWPGATFNIRIGVIGLLIANIIGKIKSTKDSSEYYSYIFKRSAIFGGIGFVLIILPRTTWLEIRYRNYPTYIDAVKKAMTDPNNRVLRDSVEYQRQVMEYSKDHD